MALTDNFMESKKEKNIDTRKKLKAGIIGCGWIAEAHAETLKRCPDVDIVAGADLIPGKAEAFFEKMEMPGVRCYPDHQAMLDNETLDIVSVCTYNSTHAECSVYALRKGVHVLCEKPMCVTLEEAADMCRAEKESGKLLCIGFQPRFDENMQMIKKIVDSGELGQIYYIQTGGGRRSGIPTPFGTTFIEEKTSGIGALGDIGCYSLDMVLRAVGYPRPLTVTGYTSSFFGKDPATYPQHPEYAEIFGVDDFAAAFIRLEGGIILDFRIAWDMHLDTPGDTIIMGTKGSLRIPSTGCWNGSEAGPMKVYHRMAGNNVDTVIPVAESDWAELFYRKVRTFINAVKEGRESPIPSREILLNQAIIDGIAKSAKAGREIEIVIPEI